MIKVSLRYKKISGGRQSLYLDYYPAIPTSEGNTRREFLKMYVLDKPKTPIDKEANRTAIAIAEGIRSARQISVLQNDFTFLLSTAGIDIITYFSGLADKQSGQSYGIWKSALQHLKIHFGQSPKAVSALTLVDVLSFKEYLESNPAGLKKGRSVSANSAKTYFDKFKFSLNKAYRDGLLNADLSKMAKSIKAPDTRREFLLLDELQRMAEANCSDLHVKRAALFSALTGLRYSDVAKLTWGEVQPSQNGYALRYQQKKTKGHETLPVSSVAVQILGERGKDDELVFNGLKYNGAISDKINRWAKEAKVTKHLTFHSFRHTYATLQIEAGTDLFTVSKLLGHKEIKTTQIYTKLTDKKKQAAVDKIIISLNSNHKT